MVGGRKFLNGFAPDEDFSAGTLLASMGVEQAPQGAALWPGAVTPFNECTPVCLELGRASGTRMLLSSVLHSGPTRHCAIAISLRVAYQ